MPELTKNIEIQASPEKVFAFINDTEKVNQATKGYLEREITSKGPVGIGATYHFVASAGGRIAEFDMEVTEFEKDKKVGAKSVGASKFKMDTLLWILEPTSKGTKATFQIKYKLPYSVLGEVIDKLKVGKDMDRLNSEMLQKIKKAIES